MLKKVHRLWLFFLGILATLPGLGQVAGWESHGPAFGHVQALAVSPFDDRVVYAGASDDSTQQSALFVSFDGGRNWTRLSVAPPRETISALAIDPGNSSRMLARTTGNPGAVYQSEDAGATWVEVLRLGQAGSVFFDTSGSGTAYALAFGGHSLWRGVGRGWTLLQPSVPGELFLPPTAAFPGASGELFVIAYVFNHPGFFNGYRLLRKDESGWTLAGGPPCPLYGKTPSTAFDPNDSGILYATAPPCAGLFRTHDGGHAWHSVPALQALDVRQIVLAPVDPATLYVLIASDGRILRSVDGDETWSAFPAPPAEPTEIALGPSGRILYAATGDGVFAWTVRSTRLVPR